MLRDRRTDTVLFWGRFGGILIKFQCVYCIVILEVFAPQTKQKNYKINISFRSMEIDGEKRQKIV